MHDFQPAQCCIMAACMSSRCLQVALPRAEEGLLPPRYTMNVCLQNRVSPVTWPSLQDPATTVIVSVSPQSRASLAARHGLTPGQCQRKLTALFRQPPLNLTLTLALVPACLPTLHFGFTDPCPTSPRLESVHAQPRTQIHALLQAAGSSTRSRSGPRARHGVAGGGSGVRRTLPRAAGGRRASTCRSAGAFGLVSIRCR